MSSNDNSVRVQIVGDASGVAPAVDIAKGSIAGLGPVLESLNATMAALTQEMQAGFAKIAAGSTEAFGGMGIAAQAGAAKVAESAGVVTLASERIVAAGEMAKTKWEAVGAGFSKINAAMIGVMAVLAGGEIFKSTIEATTKLTAENRNLARALGVTLEKASGVHSAMTKLGIGVDQVVAASQKMVRQLKAHEDQFIKVGIATRDSNGHFLSTLDILTNGLGTLRKYKEGVDQTAVAQMMFGRGAGDLTALLRLNNAEIEEGARVAKELGLVTTSEGVEAMHKYKDATREVGEVMEGMKVAIGNALLPVLTELATWMRGHGAQAIKYLKDTLIDLIDTFKETVLEVRFMIANVTLWLTHFLGFAEGVKMTAEIIGASIKMMAKIAFDALHFNWGDIEADWSAGMASIDAIATRHLGHIAGEAAKAQAALAMVATQLANVRNHKNKDQDELGSPLDLYASGQFRRPDEGGGLREDDITGKKPKKEKKEKKPKDDLMQTLNDELDVLKASWEAKQILQGTAQAFSLETEAAFWDKAKARANLSAKDRLEIDKKWITAHQAIQKQTIAEQLESFKEEIDAAGKNWTTKKAILQSEADFKSKMYGASSKEALAAAEAVKQAARQEAEQLMRLADQVQKHKQELALISVTEAEQEAQNRVALGRETAAELIQQERQFEDQRHEIRRAALAADLALINPDRDPEKFAQVSQQIETLERQHQLKLSEIDRTAVIERTTVQRGAINSIASSWGSALSKMVTLQASFASTIKGLWQGIQQAISGAIGQMLQKFIAAQLTKLIYGKAEAASTIAKNAAMAGAGGVASMAAAPFPLDLGAPAFGASMAAAAGSFGSIAMASGGDWNVTEGLYGLHQNEMVLPAWAAQPLRDMIGGKSSGAPASFNAPGAANDGGLHVTINAMDSQSVRRLFMDNKGHLAEAVRKYARDGGR